MNSGAIRPCRLFLKNNDDGEFVQSLSLALSSLSSSCPGGESQPQTPSESGQCTPTQYDVEAYDIPTILGPYNLVQRVPGVSSHKDVLHYEAFNIFTGRKLLCKIFPKRLYNGLQRPYWAAGNHEHVLSILDIIHHDDRVFLIHPRIHGDLHTYLRDKRKLKESEACLLLEQIVHTVAHCHSKSIILRDLKLRKFVFIDPEQKCLALDSFEDAVVLEDYSNDLLDDKHGCPAYVSPEIISMARPHSGRAADLWSLGVISYILMVGRYPFHHRSPSLLFGKIRRAKFSIPADVSPLGRSLIACLLRYEPSDRMSASQVTVHPWFTRRIAYGEVAESVGSEVDQPRPPVVCPGKRYAVSDLYDHCVPELKVVKREATSQTPQNEHTPFPLF